MYKEASKQALRVATTRGLLTVEQLWTLPVQELDTLAVQLDEEYKKSGEKSFVIRKTNKNKLAKLKFDIVLDILTTKVEEQSTALERAENKKHNEKIDALIADKQDTDLKKKSISQLEKMKK